MFSDLVSRLCQNPAPMGRKRTIHHDLPPRMARKGQSYYYVCNAPRKWIPLGSDRAKANRKWAEYEDAGSSGLTVGGLVQRYLDRKERAANTARQYRMYQRVIDKAFPIPAAQMRSPHVAIWRELSAQKARKHFTNGCIAVLLAAFKLGHEQGECELLTVSLWEVEPRKRLLTNEEFRAIRERAVPWMQLAMDIGYMTAARPSDIRALTWAQVGDRLAMRQKKTLQRMAFTMTPELAEVIATARQRPVMGLYVVATDRGRGISEDVWNRAWLAACLAAGVKDAQFRDIRGQSATKAKDDGQDYQALLGHASRRMSDRYIKGISTTVAEPLRKKL